jgi:hypothetical protein
MSAIEAAPLVGVSTREAVAIATSDPKIFAFPMLATDGAIDRMKRWFAASQPVADLARIVYRGDPGIRAILLAALADAPMPARWWAVEKIVWAEIGRGNRAGFSTWIPGDANGLIVLSGSTSDAVLPSLILHELGHQWCASVEDPAPRATEIEPAALAEWRSARAAHVLAEMTVTGRGIDEAAWLLYRDEWLANSMAKLCGHPCGAGLATDAYRVGLIRDSLQSVRGLATEIVADVDREIASKLAACETNPDESLSMQINATDLQTGETVPTTAGLATSDLAGAAVSSSELTIAASSSATFAGASVATGSLDVVTDSSASLRGDQETP